ncbi:MAG TPA: CHASE2 domain-containing protein, partial [Gammaproteobacteria bacterium]|nr:CHASE2 domain-containing protein [Gammaproteobacteria bacterium]
MGRWQLSRWQRGLFASALIGFFGAAFAITPLGLDFEKNFGLSWLFKIRGPVQPPNEVAVIAIDSSTGKKLDLPKMPRDWPRSVHARVLDSLVERGADVVVFDFNFAKPKSNGEDQVFAAAIATADRVVLYQVLTGRKQPIYDSTGRQRGSLWVEEATPPAEPLARAAKGLGSFPLPKTEQAAYEFWTFKASARAAPTTASIALQLHALDHYDLWLDILDQADAGGLTDIPSSVDQIGGASEIRSLMSKFYNAFNRDDGLYLRVRSTIETIDGLKPKEKRLLSALANLYGGSDNRYINFYGPPGTITTVP